MFPTLAGHAPGIINLEEEAKAYVTQNPHAENNPFLDPHWCAAFVADLHRMRGSAWSYGGYLEDRSILWNGSYLSNTGAYLHLGIDCNVPIGTPVHADFDARVIYADHDPDQSGGWGGRVVLDPHLIPRSDYVIMYAHLSRAAETIREDTLILKHALIGHVGTREENGGWYPHVHVQMVEREFFKRLIERDELHLLDGYASEGDIEVIRRLFPDPTPFLCLP